ncbi:MAG: hypothetical protein LBS16_03530 [Prevotellaceae bacterium]|jgi:hypothetical protein|nr:hypothetical protein [Prevotellaceae bacterium]
MPSAAENLVKKTTQVKRYSSIAPFVSQKHSNNGKTSGLKKISTFQVVFFAALVATAATLRRCTPAHSATLR